MLLNMGSIIGVRVEDERRAQFERAASAQGKKVSEWLRDLGIAAVSPPAAVKQQVVKQPIFEEPVRESVYEYDPEYAAAMEGTIPAPSQGEITKPDLEQPKARLTAGEIAAAIPGVQLGIPKPPEADKPADPGPTQRGGLRSLEDW